MKNLYTRLLKYTFRYKGLFSLSILGFFLFALADISAVEWLKGSLVLLIVKKKVFLTL
ncbi:MAG: hypothetical protein CM15mP12_0970 [Gammaproteobacteria bacterium]|nr:MAG: hypothetical protein CM15mP12_0970 [Gammaproteobacteria bacterium]